MREDLSDDKLSLLGEANHKLTVESVPALCKVVYVSKMLKLMIIHMVITRVKAGIQKMVR